MVTKSQLAAAFTRASAFISSGVCCTIAGSFVRQLDIRDMDHGGRIDYVLALSCISIVASLVLMPPKRYSFLAFPFDAIMFALWMVAFVLLIDLSPGCHGVWYRWVWMFAWMSNKRCDTWKTLLAFSFISGFMWIANAALGAHNCLVESGRKRKQATLPMFNDFARRDSSTSQRSWPKPAMEPTEVYMKYAQ